MFTEPRHRDSEDGSESQEACSYSGMPQQQQQSPIAADPETPQPDLLEIPPAEPSMAETLSKVMAGLKEGKGLLECCLQISYVNVESKLKTTVGLEVRADQGLDAVRNVNCLLRLLIRIMHCFCSSSEQDKQLLITRY